MLIVCVATFSGYLFCLESLNEPAITMVYSILVMEIIKQEMCCILVSCWADVCSVPLWRFSEITRRTRVSAGEMSVSRGIVFCSVFEPWKSTLLSRLLKAGIPTPFASAVDRGSEVSKDLLFLCRRPYKEWHGSSTGAKLLECYPILWQITQARNITRSAADCLKSLAFSECSYRIFRKMLCKWGDVLSKRQISPVLSLADCGL